MQKKSSNKVKPISARNSVVLGGSYEFHNGKHQGAKLLDVVIKDPYYLVQCLESGCFKLEESVLSRLKDSYRESLGL